MRSIIRVIDSTSEATGKIVQWACVALILVLCYEVTARYAFNAPTIWAQETSCMLGCTIIALGWAYTHRHHGHVRVDVFYAHLPPRGKVLVDVLCALLFLFPYLAILTYAAAGFMWVAWLENEVLIKTYWYPPAGPIRTVVFLGLCLLALQGVAQFIRDSYLLIRKKPF